MAEDSDEEDADYIPGEDDERDLDDVPESKEKQHSNSIAAVVNGAKRKRRVDDIFKEMKEADHASTSQTSQKTNGNWPNQNAATISTAPI